MSANLKWEPSNRKANTLPDALKFVLRDKWGLESRASFSKSTLPYLAGLRDAGVEGAQELIDAIEKYEEVDVWLEY